MAFDMPKFICARTCGVSFFTYLPYIKELNVYEVINSASSFHNMFSLVHILQFSAQSQLHEEKLHGTNRF